MRLIRANVGNTDDAELDPIERFVGRFFGKKALTDEKPGGLKRLDPEKTPEIYPAVTDVWADPLPSDDPAAALVRPLLARTQLERKPLRCAPPRHRAGAGIPPIPPPLAPPR